MPVDRELLEILACPACKKPVEEVREGAGLRCGQCGRVFPVEGDIPVMLLEEAEEGPATTPPGSGDEPAP